MATLGQVKGNKNYTRNVCVLAAADADNSPPDDSEDGVPVYQSDPTGDDEGISYPNHSVNEASLFVKLTGDGAVSAKFRVWVYLIAAGAWSLLGAGDVNDGNAVSGTDEAAYTEPLLYLGHFDRVYVEMTDVTGTAAMAEAWISTPRMTL